MKTLLASVLSAVLAAGPAAAERFPNLEFSFDQARADAADYRRDMFSRNWVSFTSTPGASCADAITGVRPLFVLPEDQALVRTIAVRASARGLKVGEECRKLVVDAASEGLDLSAVTASMPAEGFSREGLLKNVEFPALVSREPAVGPRAGKRRDAVYLGSIAFVAGGDAFDMWTTFRALDRGAYEANPLMAALGERNKAGIATLNIGLQTGLILFNHYFLYKRGHKKAATILNYVTGGVHVGAGVHNLRAVR